MPDQSRDLAVVIVSYNTREFLGPCLQALPAAIGRLAAVTWVVDNASPDGSAALVRERFPWARLVESPRNGGYAFANNLGLRAAGCFSPCASAPSFRYAALL